MLVVAVLGATAAPVSAQTPGAQGPPDTQVSYIWPVEGEVIDPFRPPKNRYGPGNRGLEFATRDGGAFWAAADGFVSWAGQVGGKLHVTVTHPDGLRVSYSGVATILVSRGQRVSQADRLGTTGDRLHVGVRDGDTYLDPAPIFGPRNPGPRIPGPPQATFGGRARLVPSPAGIAAVYRLWVRWLHSAAGFAAR